MRKAQSGRRPQTRRNKNMAFARGSLLLAASLTILAGGAVLISGCASKPVAATPGPDGVQTVKVTVRHGYSPNRIVAKANQPLKLEFYRDEEPGAESCDKELDIPEENVRLPLPSRESQIVEIKPHAAGDMGFQCGMHMIKGTITFK